MDSQSILIKSYLVWTTSGHELKLVVVSLLIGLVMLTYSLASYRRTLYDAVT